MSHEHPHSQEHHNRPRKPLHRDWRFHLAVVVMLVAIAAYILSENEMLGPKKVDKAIPAPAAAPIAK